MSVKGSSRAQRWVSTEKLWKWIDERGKEFGIGRPYLDRDPPHVAPIDGQEYVSRRGGAKTQEAEAKTKKTQRRGSEGQEGQAGRLRGTIAARPSSAKTAKIAKAAKIAKTARKSEDHVSGSSTHFPPWREGCKLAPLTLPSGADQSYQSSRPAPARRASARIPDRIGQHGVKLTLGEFLGNSLVCFATGFRVDTTLSTGRAQAAANAGLRVGTATILGLAVGGL